MVNISGTRHWWVSGTKMTVWVRTSSWGIITNTAPVTRKFIGQPLENLTNWLNKDGNLKVKDITDV